MEYAELVNRTSRDLNVTWDGRKYALVPGKNALPLIVAEAAKRQNPIMGSEDPRTLETEFLVGVEKWGDPITPLTDAEAFPSSPERWNRQKLVGARPSEVVKGNGGALRHEASSPLPIDGTFVKP